MTTTYNWTIAQLERNTADGGISVAHWRVSAVDGEYTASAYGTAGFTPDPSAPDFILFDQLTEAEVLGWVWEDVDKAETEARLADNIEEQKAPKVETGLPWG